LSRHTSVIPIRGWFYWLVLIASTKSGELLFWENLGAEEGVMPHYEYLCTSCGNRFSAVLTLAEHEESKVKCPKCGGTKVEQQWAAFFATTSKKS
jgi:putative FmdB family regulatory protein